MDGGPEESGWVGSPSFRCAAKLAAPQIGDYDKY